MLNFFIVYIVLFSFFNSVEINAIVVVYPGHSILEEAPSLDYSVSVEGKDVFVYTSFSFDDQAPTSFLLGRPVSNLSFAYFDTDFLPMPVEVKVKLLRNQISEPVLVRPLSRNIKFSVTNSTISLQLTESCNLSIEPFGAKKPLHLFVNNLLANPPRPNDPDLLYFGPGIHYIDSMVLQSNQSIFVAGGALVRTKVQPNVRSSIRIIFRFKMYEINKFL